MYIVVPIMVLVAVLSLVMYFVSGEEPQEISTTGTLFMSEDGGLTWKLLPEFRGGDISTLDFDSVNNNSLIVGTQARGIWTGTRSGKDWIQHPGGVGESSRVFDILQPITENKYIALVLFNERGRVLRYENGDRTELFFTPLERFAFLKGYRTISGYLRIIGSDGGFYESRNDGRTWRSTSRFQAGLLAMTFDPEKDNEIWVIDPNGDFYKSTDGGVNWTNLTDRLREFQGYNQVGFIYFDPRAGILYHGSKHGLLRSFDGGASWQRVELTVAPESLPATSMAVDPNNSLKLYVAILNQVYISEDGGSTWKGVQVTSGGVITNMLVNPRNNREIFIGFRGI